VAASSKKAAQKSKPPGSLWAGLKPGDFVVVDTAPIIYMLDDHPVLADRFAGLFEAHASGQLQIAVTTITLAEVLTGPLRHKQTVLAKRYQKALEDFELVSITPDIAVTAAQLRASTGLRLPDALQAAAALELGAVALVTHDRDFSKLSHLNIIGAP
jgi:predicted nucleic acid-binding protein